MIDFVHLNFVYILCILTIRQPSDPLTCRSHNQGHYPEQPYIYLLGGELGKLDDFELGSAQFESHNKPSETILLELLDKVLYLPKVVLIYLKPK